MRKVLTILVPTMKMHSSVELIFPRLQTANKELVVGTTKDQLLPHISLGNRILIRWGSYYETADIADAIDYNSREAIIDMIFSRVYFSHWKGLTSCFLQMARWNRLL